MTCNLKDLEQTEKSLEKDNLPPNLMKTAAIYDYLTLIFGPMPPLVLYLISTGYMHRIIRAHIIWIKPIKAILSPRTIPRKKKYCKLKVWIL